ncbi:YvrJ family protein [Pallidibacillus pasinlerensis]|uniref:YvrJ family protein n=1 Tax=Pallidibacillus pasinlerensis TaxID=2703818 RepID=A0ABX0A4R8_9BACI|nr:YvrJ family protein [Pallidibacillus pasinlerensis]NCU18438.1 YvrJ family protein [Pallidibacillus pasinlerensis]
MSELYALIGELGFPIVVTLILLYRVEAKLDQVIQSIDKLPEKLTKA